MSFKRKFKKMFRHFIGDFTGVQWRDLDHKKVYAAIAIMLFILILLVALIISLFTKGDEKKQQDPQQQVQEELLQDTAAEDEETEKLEKDAYPEINELLNKYFTGISSGDLAMVEETVDVLGEEEKKDIEKKKDYIEAYNDVICYTRKGMEEGSFVVFAAYEMKIYNIETAAPGIMPFYVYQTEDGSYRIYNQDASEEMQNYVLEMAEEEEAASIIAEIDARYQQRVSEDEDLGKFVEAMLGSQEEEEPEADVPETDQPEVVPEEETPAQEPETPSEEENSAEATAVNKQMQFKEAVRIRADRSSESERLTNAYQSDLVMVIENYSDGWSKVNYHDIVGYCMTEFLEEAQ